MHSHDHCSWSCGECLFLSSSYSMAPFVILQRSFMEDVVYLSSSNCPKDVRFLFKSGICFTLFGNRTCPFGVWIRTSPFSIIFEVSSLARYFFPKLPETVLHDFMTGQEWNNASDLNPRFYRMLFEQSIFSHSRWECRLFLLQYLLSTCLQLSLAIFWFLYIQA